MAVVEAASFLEALLKALDDDAVVGPFVPMAFRVLAPVKVRRLEGWGERHGKTTSGSVVPRNRVQWVQRSVQFHYGSWYIQSRIIFELMGFINQLITGALLCGTFFHVFFFGGEGLMSFFLEGCFGMSIFHGVDD